MNYREADALRDAILAEIDQSERREDDGSLTDAAKSRITDLILEHVDATAHGYTPGPSSER